MTRYSIKIRRNKLTKGRIESHKDFKALQQMSVEKQHSGSLPKLLAMIVAILILIVMIIFGILKINDKSADRVPTEEIPDIYDEFKN